MKDGEGPLCYGIVALSHVITRRFTCHLVAEWAYSSKLPLETESSVCTGKHRKNRDYYCIYANLLLRLAQRSRQLRRLLFVSIRSSRLLCHFGWRPLRDRWCPLFLEFLWRQQIRVQVFRAESL